MDAILRIFHHTPLWVFVLFAALIVLGAQALRTRTIPIWRLLIVPAVFILWGVVSLVAKVTVFPILIVDWLGTTAIGFAVAWLTTRLDGLQVHRSARIVEVPGSVIPLMRNLAIFAAKYCLTAAMAVAPGLQPSLTPWDIAVSGLSAGYFIGWLFRFTVRYRNDGQAELASPAG